MNKEEETLAVALFLDTQNQILNNTLLEFHFSL